MNEHQHSPGEADIMAMTDELERLGDGAYIELPSQWFDRHKPELTGCQRLIREVLLGALHDLLLGEKIHTLRAKRLYDEARTWLETPETAGCAALSFPFVAAHLGFDAEGLKSRLLRRFPARLPEIRASSRSRTQKRRLGRFT